MVKIALQIQATLENIDKLSTCHPNYTFFLKIKCLNCGEISEKWHSVTESETFPTSTAKSNVHFIAKCKLCSRENSMDILKDSNGELCSTDLGKFVTLVVFDCRGLEPIDFDPREGWEAVAENSSQQFRDIDLSEKEWVDYDDKCNQSVGIYDFKSQFIRTK